MTYALIIKTADGEQRLASYGTHYTPFNSQGLPMRYQHPSAARRAYAAFQRKFAEYVGLRPVQGYMVLMNDVPAVCAGRLPLPKALD